MTYELEILTELRAINGMLVKIFEAMQQQPQFSQVGYYVGGCDHQWVESKDAQYTSSVPTYHCHKCGAVRA